MPKQEIVVTVIIPCANFTTTHNNNNRMFVPSFILSNVMPLSLKVDEIRIVGSKTHLKLQLFSPKHG